MWIDSRISDLLGVADLSWTYIPDGEIQIFPGDTKDLPIPWAQVVLPH